jgi:hypothetical protein
LKLYNFIAPKSEAVRVKPLCQLVCIQASGSVSSDSGSLPFIDKRVCKLVQMVTER